MDLGEAVHQTESWIARNPKDPAAPAMRALVLVGRQLGKPAKRTPKNITIKGPKDLWTVIPQSGQPFV